VGRSDKTPLGTPPPEEEPTKDAFDPSAGFSRIDTVPHDFAALLRRERFEIGDVIGNRYKLVSVLGSGGMGQVFAAENVAIGLRVAVKVLKPELLANPVFRQRFQHEAQAIASIEHPNVARFFDLIIGDPTFMVMEFVRGPTLASVLEAERQLAIPRAVAVATRLCWGLEAAHAAGIVHRDLKPSNVILAPDPEWGETPKIIDFGVAKLAAAAQLTRTGQVVGTPHYMSPEQIAGGDVDARSDIFALGCLFYELVCGHPPVTTVEGDVQIFYRQIHERPSPLSSQVADVPPALDRLVDRALRKDPAERFTSMKEMAGALAAVAEELRADRGPTLTVDPAPAGRPSAPVSWPLAAAAGIAIAAAGIAVFAVPSSHRVATRSAPRTVLMAITEPDGASVEIDGRATSEKTPAAIGDLSTGRHTVRLRLQGYADLSRSVDIAPGGRAVVDAILEPASRTVEVRTVPAGATVYLDGHVLSGVTPTTVTVTEGDFHALAIERTGYETVKQRLSPEDHDAKYEFQLQVEKLPRGAMTVDSDLLAHVWLDGVDTGLTTPTIVVPVAAGDHVVELRDTNGVSAVKRSIHIAQGETLHLLLGGSVTGAADGEAASPAAAKRGRVR
jgi:tRNA A-37 threonylcarbamoyl transferase component Bud32